MSHPDETGAPFYVCLSRVLIPDEVRAHLRDAEAGRDVPIPNGFPVGFVLLRTLGRIEGDLDQWIHDGTVTLQIGCPEDIEPWQIVTALGDLGITILHPVAQETCP